MPEHLKSLVSRARSFAGPHTLFLGAYGLGGAMVGTIGGIGDGWAWACWAWLMFATGLACDIELSRRASRSSSDEEIVEVEVVIEDSAPRA